MRARAGAAGRGSGALHREDVGAVHRHNRADPGCHFWVGGLTNDGHGRFTANGSTVRASRFRWTGHHRPLPPQVVVMHQGWDQPSCTRLDQQPGVTTADVVYAAAPPNTPAANTTAAQQDLQVSPVWLAGNFVA